MKIETVTGGGPEIEWAPGEVELLYRDSNGDVRMNWPMTPARAREIAEGLLEAATLAEQASDVVE